MSSVSELPWCVDRFNVKNHKVWFCLPSTIYSNLILFYRGRSARRVRITIRITPEMMKSSRKTKLSRPIKRSASRSSRRLTSVKEPPNTSSCISVCVFSNWLTGTEMTGLSKRRTTTELNCLRYSRYDIQYKIKIICFSFLYHS